MLQYQVKKFNIKKKRILENALKVLPDIINEIFSAIMDKAY